MIFFSYTAKTLRIKFAFEAQFCLLIPSSSLEGAPSADSPVPWWKGLL